MGNDSQPILCTASGTTTIGSSRLFSVCINKTLVGTLTINDGVSALASFAIGTATGTYHLVPLGARYGNLNIVLSAADNVTAYFARA